MTGGLQYRNSCDLTDGDDVDGSAGDKPHEEHSGCLIPMMMLCHEHAGVARMAWAVLAKGEVYRPPKLASSLACR